MVKMDIKKTIFIIATLLGLWLVSGIFANVFTIADSDMVDPSANVALIKLNAEITTDSSYNSVSSSDFVRKLDDYSSYPNIKAIIIEINSPGGSPVGSKEIVDAIKKLRDDKKRNLTVVCYIRDIGASGAYWVASSTEKIYANELSLVGGIGVTGSYLEFSGLLDKYNVTYEQLIAGQYKDMGTPLRKLTVDEKNILQRQLNIMYEIFMHDVAKNRNLSYDYIKNYSNGMVYLGIEAKKYNLIDEFGGKSEALEYIKTKIGADPIVYEPQEEKSLLSSLLGSVMSENPQKALEEKALPKT